ncbi:hypothetical protein BU17DRAFT_70937 [Hysterangium stoloniferum]|nr:hypothetical protein BU17DRAFT_70937 [Hysterangium stoloniferum]
MTSCTIGFRALIQMEHNCTQAEEQARTNRQPSSINVPSSPTEAASSDDNGLEIEDDNPYSKHLERDPTIWSLYMKKTEKEVKELANSLQVGVDDLLIFAGLFGAILTAFLIEISVTLSSATFVPYLHENGWRSIFLYPPEVAQVMHANVSFVLREHSNGTSTTAIPEHHRSPSMSRNTRDIGARSPVNEYVERLAAVLLTYNLYEQELRNVRLMCTDIYRDVWRPGNDLLVLFTTHGTHESVDGLNLFFRFRWVLIAFKREFVFDGVLRMWETRHLPIYEDGGKYDEGESDVFRTRGFLKTRVSTVRVPFHPEPNGWVRLFCDIDSQKSPSKPQQTMLNLKELSKVLSSLLHLPRLHTAVLCTPSGDLISHAGVKDATYRDRLRVLVAVATELWREINDEDIGMAEGESFSTLQTSRNLDPPFLLALNAKDDVEWYEMQIKARGVVNHLAVPLIEAGDHLRLLPPAPTT